MGMYDDFIEVEHHGEVTGTLMFDDDEKVPFLIVGHVCYDVTVTNDLSMAELMGAVGRDVTLQVDRMSRAGMIAPELGHIVVSGMSLPELKAVP